MSPPAKEDDPFLEGGGGLLKPRARTTFFLTVIASLVLVAILFFIPYFISLEMIAFWFLIPRFVASMAGIWNGEDAKSDLEIYGHGRHLTNKVLFWSNLIVLIFVVACNVFSAISYGDTYALKLPLWVLPDFLVIPALSVGLGWFLRRKYPPGETIAAVAFTYMTLRIFLETILGFAVIGASCANMRDANFGVQCPAPDGFRSPGYDIVTVGIIFRLLYSAMLISFCFMIRKYLPSGRYSVSVGFLFFISVSLLTAVLSFLPILLLFSFSRDHTIWPIFGQVGSAFYNWLFSRSPLPTVPSSEYYSSSPVKSLTFLPL